VGVTLSLAGVSDVALRSVDVTTAIRAAIATAVTGVGMDQVMLGDMQVVQEVAYVEVNISGPSQGYGQQVAQWLRRVDLAAFVNDQLALSGLSLRVPSVAVVRSSVDSTLTLKNLLERCSDADQCGGCEVVWSEPDSDWVRLTNASSNSCSWISSAGQCMASEGIALLPCQTLTSEMDQQLVQPQLLVRVRVDGMLGAGLSSHLVRAAMWASQLTDMSSIAVLSLNTWGDDNSLATNATATLVFGLPSRDMGVVMLAHVAAAVVGGETGQFLTTAGHVASVDLLEARLSNAAKTGVRFHEPTASGIGRHGRCERVTVDTATCSSSFNLTSPYLNATALHFSSPDGSVDVPAPCDLGKNFTEAPFPPSSRHGTVVFMDGHYVDLERAVPHVIAALPAASKPQSAIALTHSVEQWQVSLSNKLFAIVPKLRGTGMTVVDTAHADVLSDFVRVGGHVVVMGGPLHSLALINQLFHTALHDLAPADGGISFMPGTNVMHPHPAVAHSVLGRCSSDWADQNAFTFAALPSLPDGARVLYMAGDKVAAFDFVPPGHNGSVVYFGFDFYDSPSVDTACVLRHVMALQLQH